VTRGRHYQRRDGARRSAWIAGAIGVAAGVVAVVLWTGHHHAAVKTATTPLTSAPVLSTATTDSPSTTAAPTTTAATTTTVPPTTTTTLVVPPPVVGTDSITYTLPPGTPVLVAAVDSCWIQVRPSSSGSVTQQEILQPGQQVVLPSPVWIRFGDPSSARVTVGSTPLRLPTLAGQLIVVNPAP